MPAIQKRGETTWGDRHEGICGSPDMMSYVLVAARVPCAAIASEQESWGFGPAERSDRIARPSNLTRVMRITHESNDGGL